MHREVEKPKNRKRKTERRTRNGMLFKRKKANEGAERGLGEKFRESALYLSGKSNLAGCLVSLSFAPHFLSLHVVHADTEIHQEGNPYSQ